jgi:two-component system sensor histidine kinase YesM
MNHLLRSLAATVMKVHGNTKLKYKLMLAYSLVFTVSILSVGFTAYYQSRDFMTNSEKNAAAQSMVQLHNAIDSFLEIYFNKSEMVFFNLQLQKHLSTYQEDIDDLVYAHKDINDIVKQIINDVKRPYLKNSYYFGGNIQLLLYTKNSSLFSDGQTIFNYDDIKDMAWNLAMLETDTYFIWESRVKFGDQYYVALNRRLIDFGTSKDLGVMRLLIPVERIQNIIAKSIENSDYQLIYTDEEDRMITSYGHMIAQLPGLRERVKQVPLDSGVSESIIDGSRYLSGAMKSEITGWKLTYFTHKNNITDKVNRISYSIIVSILVSIVLCIFIALLISAYMTQRIDVLVSKTNKAKQGNLIITDVIRGNDEIGQLDKNFNSMIEQIHNLIEVEYKSKILLNHTKFELLQEQINPHLHYNTLAMIASLAKKSNQTEIYEVTNHLIRFYKNMLNKGKLIISLAAEFEIIRHYLELSKFVYSLDIDVMFEVEDDIMDYYSIKMLLQPLVENAIFHGIMPSKKGTIVIGGREVEKGIELYVSDDGAGLPEHMIDYIRNLTTDTDEKHGYGLTNVVRRFQLFFGDSFSFECESSQGMGTTFVVRIPKFTENEIKLFLKEKYLYS